MKGSDIANLQVLLDHGADLSLMCSTGRTAIQYAKERNFNEIADFLQAKAKEQQARNEALAGMSA
jgi:ankyrin repeat protein